jgi:hypothetical protein
LLAQEPNRLFCKNNTGLKIEIIGIGANRLSMRWYLEDNKVPFCIRIKGSFKISVYNGKAIAATINNPSPVAVYLRRWEIECLFVALKSHGFRFEDTHMICPDKIEKLLAVLTIGFCWAHKVGQWQDTRIPIKQKRFANGNIRPAYTFFGYGLDVIRRFLFNSESLMTEFKIILLLMLPDNNRATAGLIMFCRVLSK